MFGKSKNCLRPSYFPFTKPSAEVDIYWGLKQKLIIELPKEPVIRNHGLRGRSVLKMVDPEEYNGFAFEWERTLMLLYQIVISVCSMRMMHVSYFKASI
jgi:phenylalanyl-tRNA synthetase alpha chain